MKNLSLLFIGLLMIPMFLLTSCDRGEDPVIVDTTDKSAILRDYMIANNFDLHQVLGGTGLPSPSFVVTPAAASTVMASTTPYALILDIRQPSGAEGFDKGKIAGAVNVPFANILTEVDKITDVTKPILVVCYTGNQATYATALLRMYGYRNAVALKWGMAGWNKTTFGVRWFSAIGNTASTSANFNLPPAAASPTDFPNGPFTTVPAIITPAIAGQEILKNRVRAVVAEGFKGLTGTEVLNSVPNNTFAICNYFPLTDNQNYGNIKTAVRIQIPTGSTAANWLATDTHKKFNPAPATKIAVYCYTGQTSGVVSAFLRVLGYDANSVTFGMNGLWNTSPGWGTSANRWDVVNGSPEAQTYTVN